MDNLDRDKKPLTWGHGGDRRQTGAGDTEVTVGSPGAEGDKAWLVGGDLAVDPCLIFGHPRVYSREIGQGASSTKAHHSTHNPLVILFAHQRST